MARTKKSIKISTTILLVIVAFLMIVQSVDFSNVMRNMRFGTVLQFVPSFAKNATMMFVPMVFGAVYGRKKRQDWAEAFRFWLLAVCALVIFYLAYFIYRPWRFNMWLLWGIFFPVVTSTSIILAAVIFGFLAKPTIANFQEKMNNKQNLLILCVLSVAGFALSAGMMPFNLNIYSLYLVLYFAWGMYLSKLSLSKKQVAWLVLVGIIAFLVVLIGVGGFNGVRWYQLWSGRSADWNAEFLDNPTSPVMLIGVVAVFELFKPIILNFSRKQMRFLILVVVLSQAPIAQSFANSVILTANSSLNKLIYFVIVFIVAFILSQLFEKFLYRRKFAKQTINYLANSESLVLIVEDAWDHLVAWAKRNRVFLLTWVWFYVIAFVSFLIESNNMRINYSTSNDINAVIFLLGRRFFAIILTAIFIDAAFTILYFITTRYWVSNIVISIIVVGWAIANKVKLELRGEPIYPSELGEAVNAKSLLSMVNANMLVVIAVALVVLICLMIFLEIKHPIKKHGSWKRRGIWALISLLLFLTPLRFNHEDDIIHHLSYGFDNRPMFTNPEHDLQINGPVLNFMNYIDLQVMDKPNNYSQKNIDKIVKKYQRASVKINRKRKNDLAKQTIIFNLSESFADPYTFPTIKIDPSAPNPVKYIQSLKNKSTYGYMMSAGYGGGTANMEWESITGFNMGLFKTTLTPYVQVVPNYSFYPTIGMNFNYASAIHPFIGTYYSRVEDYGRFKFDKFAYLGSKYKIIDQHHIDNSPYNSDQTAYANALAQINSRKNGQFINLISMQNHMPYNNWYKNNEYMGKISGKLFDNNPSVKTQMATYVKGVQYTDQAVKQFIAQIDKIKKPITLVFYGDHYPSVLPQNLITQYPVQMHSTRYFIYTNKYAREHGAKIKLNKKYKYVNTSDFIAMMLQQTDTKVTPFQALLTEIHKKLPTITINLDEQKGFQLVNQKGNLVDPKTLTNEQQALLRDYEMIQYDMTNGNGYALEAKDFYQGK